GPPPGVSLGAADDVPPASRPSTPHKGSVLRVRAGPAPRDAGTAARPDDSVWRIQAAGAPFYPPAPASRCCRGSQPAGVAAGVAAGSCTAVIVTVLPGSA